MLSSCICVTDFPSWLLCWLLCCIARTCRTWWCDGGRLALAVHTHTHTERENIWAVRTNPPPFSCWLGKVWICHLCAEDAFRTLAVSCTVIVKDNRGPDDPPTPAPAPCTASVDAVSCSSGVICDEVSIVYTGCCQLRCLKYLTIIIYY